MDSQTLAAAAANRNRKCEFYTRRVCRWFAANVRPVSGVLAEAGSIEYARSETVVDGDG